MRNPFAMPSVADPDQSPVIAWNELLIWFFRIMAIFQIMKGLVHWAMLIGGDISFTDLAQDSFVEMRSANIYFAVLDPVAGVGLWLTSSWGAVLWLLAAASQAAVLLGFPEIFGRMWTLMMFEFVAIGLYVTLTWKVAQTNEDAS